MSLQAPLFIVAEPADFDRYWRVRTTLPDRFGQRCRVIARGKRNSCAVEFEDGYRTITSRWSVRKIKPQPQRKPR